MSPSVMSTEDEIPSDGNEGDENRTSTRFKPNSLGLGLPSTQTPAKDPFILTIYPHLGHYIYNLLASVQTSPSRLGSAGQHPLSVSSSGSDDDSLQVAQMTPQKQRDAPKSRTIVDKEALVRKIAGLLDNEEEEEVKGLLRPHMGSLGKVSKTLHIE